MDLNNPVVIGAMVLAVALLLDVLMAGGAVTSHAACGVAGAMGTHVGWLGILLIGALAWLALGGGPVAGALAAPASTDVVLLLIGAVLAAGVGLVLVVAWLDRGRAAVSLPASSAEVLRRRYSSGDLSREQYRRMQVDILKDRYVRGDISLEVYEAALGRVLEELRVGRSSAALSAGAASAPDVLGDAAN